MSEIPYESKIAIEQFLTEQKEQELRKAQQNQAVCQVAVPSRKPMTAKEVIRYAKNYGFSVAEGRGRHGVHLVSPTGAECPLPMHGRGRTLATGTQYSILNFVQQNGLTSSRR